MHAAGLELPGFPRIIPYPYPPHPLSTLPEGRLDLRSFHVSSALLFVELDYCAIRAIRAIRAKCRGCHELRKGCRRTGYIPDILRESKVCLFEKKI